MSKILGNAWPVDPPRDRTPRDLPGGIYCSPSCGTSCKKAEYDNAVRASEALSQRLGEGWASHVHESMGWYYYAKKGVARVSPIVNRNKPMFPDGSFEITGYLAILDTKPQGVATAETPEDALGFAVQDLRNIQQRLHEDLGFILNSGVGV